MRGFHPPIWGLILCTGFGVYRDLLCPQGFFWRLFLSLAPIYLQRENKYDQNCAEENRCKNPCQGTRLACRDSFSISCIKTNKQKRKRYLCPQYMILTDRWLKENGNHIRICVYLLHRHLQSNNLTFPQQPSSTSWTEREATLLPHRNTAHCHWDLDSRL